MDKTPGWVYEEYKNYVSKNDRIPDKSGDEDIIDIVLHKIEEAEIWIPHSEIPKSSACFLP